LRLDPWQTVPLRASLHDLDKLADDTRGERRAAELWRRLLDASLSRFEPSPLEALERVEAAKRQAAKLRAQDCFFSPR
jgi:hypothetical protein